MASEPRTLVREPGAFERRTPLVPQIRITKNVYLYLEKQPVDILRISTDDFITEVIGKIISLLDEGDMTNTKKNPHIIGILLLSSTYQIISCFRLDDTDINDYEIPMNSTVNHQWKVNDEMREVTDITYFSTHFIYLLTEETTLTQALQIFDQHRNLLWATHHTRCLTCSSSVHRMKQISLFYEDQCRQHAKEIKTILARKINGKPEVTSISENVQNTSKSEGLSSDFDFSSLNSSYPIITMMNQIENESDVILNNELQ